MAEHNKRFSPIFVGHGSPMTAISPTNATYQFFETFGEQNFSKQKPKAILSISAHWETKNGFEVNSNSKPSQIYDFSGFPQALYDIRYKPEGNPELAQRIVDLANEYNKIQKTKSTTVRINVNETHGNDHGTWVPLSVMFPNQDVPVVQISIDESYNPEVHYYLGQALSPLLDEGVLIIASGNITHNTRDRSRQDAPEEWAIEFDKWVTKTLTESEGDERRKTLAQWSQNKYGRKAHPIEDHFVPLFVLAGLNGVGKATQIFNNFERNFSMSAYSFPITVTKKGDS